MIDINKVPDSDVIARRIFENVNMHQIQQDMVSTILSNWSDEWIDVIAENETGLHDGTKGSNDDRLKRRINKLKPVSPVSAIDNIGF